LIVAGIMSGTSADGIEVALVRITEPGNAPRGTGSGTGKPSLDRSGGVRMRLMGHASYRYPKAVREAVLSAMNASAASVADLARLNFLLGELYADAVIATQRKFCLRAELVGCHGQTLFHQGDRQAYLGRPVAVTWQTGEGALIAARVGVPVVSDFRPADMAAGGKGAPLVPFLDYLLYRGSRIGRIVQNIGGIANLTAIPAGASSDKVIAFDTGPGNMVIDAVMERMYHKPFDHNGEVAASGQVRDKIVDRLLRARFFQNKPPKTAGREEFGREFVREFVGLCGRAPKQDVVATATALTARSITAALRTFVLARNNTYRELVVSGGGAKNATLLAMLANEAKPLGLALRLSDEFGLPAVAKEAAAFALLAYETWNRRPSNMPSATGARRAAILGKISYVQNA
jgi:anhydro-N-acetylmuramic acid kinase